MADVTTNVKGTTERNGSIVVGAPKGAKADALSSKYISTPGDITSMTIKGAVGGVNNAVDIGILDIKWDSRNDDPRYYSGDAIG